MTLMVVSVFIEFDGLIYVSDIYYSSLDYLLSLEMELEALLDTLYFDKKDFLSAARTVLKMFFVVAFVVVSIDLFSVILAKHVPQINMFVLTMPVKLVIAILVFSFFSEAIMLQLMRMFVLWTRSTIESII